MSTKKPDIYINSSVLEAVGKRLKAERKARGYENQADLCEVLGIAQGRQSDYERGKYLPRAEYLLRLHEKGLDMQWVLTGMAGQLDDDDEQHLLAELHRASNELRRAAIAAALAVLGSSANLKR